MAQIVLTLIPFNASGLRSKDTDEFLGIAENISSSGLGLSLSAVSISNVHKKSSTTRYDHCKDISQTILKKLYFFKKKKLINSDVEYINMYFNMHSYKSF